MDINFVYQLNNNIKNKRYLPLIYIIRKSKKRKIINVSLKNESCFSFIKLIYEIKKQKIIQIFGDIFVKNNRDKCIMIINNKAYILTNKYSIIDENMKFLKIKLIIFTNSKINLSHMFFNCRTLKKFSVISPKNRNFLEDLKNEDKNKQYNTIKTEYSYKFKDQLYYQLYPLYKTNNSNKKANKSFGDPSFFRNKLHIIFCHCNDHDISEEDKKKK